MANYRRVVNFALLTCFNEFPFNITAHNLHYRPRGVLSSPIHRSLTVDNY